VVRNEDEENYYYIFESEVLGIFAMEGFEGSLLREVTYSKRGFAVFDIYMCYNYCYISQILIMGIVTELYIG
jgi:hypothetical protein